MASAISAVASSLFSPAGAAVVSAGTGVYSATQAGRGAGGGPPGTTVTSPAGRKVSQKETPTVNKKKLRGLLASSSNLGELSVSSPGLLNKTLGG